MTQLKKPLENFGYTEKIKTDSGVSIWLQIPFYLVQLS